MKQETMNDLVGVFLSISEQEVVRACLLEH